MSELAFVNKIKEAVELDDEYDTLNRLWDAWAAEAGKGGLLAKYELKSLSSMINEFDLSCSGGSIKDGLESLNNSNWSEMKCVVWVRRALRIQAGFLSQLGPWSC